MTLSEFFVALRDVSTLEPVWFLKDDLLIRSRSMVIEEHHVDPIGFLANIRSGVEHYTPVRFLSAAESLGLSSHSAFRIVEASDGRGESWVREQLLFAVRLPCPIMN